MDDRAYTAALAGYALMEERRKSILKRPKKNTDDLVDKLTIKKGVRTSSMGIR